MDGERLYSRGQLDLLLLSALSSGPAHGYAIITTIRERSDGAFDLAEGTVYPALRRLEEIHLVRGTWELHHGRRRKVYELTVGGRQMLEHERRQWARFSSTVDSVLRWT